MKLPEGETFPDWANGYVQKEEIRYCNELLSLAVSMSSTKQSETILRLLANEESRLHPEKSVFDWTIFSGEE